MRKLFLLLVGSLCILSLNANAAYKSNRGYMRKNGTYVSSYIKTAPNKTKLDNFSTKGNRNPFNGKKGYKSPTKNYNSSYKMKKYKY